jgi:hypothetical protein
MRPTSLLAWGAYVLCAVVACGGGDSSNPAGPDDSGGGAEGGDGGTTTDAGGDGEGVGPSDAAGDGADGGASIALGHPSAATVSDAVAAALSSYHRNTNTGDIWCLPCDGAPVVLAAASYVGDTSADARLLQQMRELLKSGNDPFATGGYSANDERNATAMYAIAKKTPRIWSQLTATELHQIDLIMEATLVADIYATADKTNMGGNGVTTFDGVANNRDFNPNYREGMIGAVLVGTEYFGGQAPVEAMLAAYDHAAFGASLQAAGLVNATWTFTLYMTNPSSGAPNPQTVQQGITGGYAMHGITLAQMLDMYVYLADDTFSATVGCGLNGGAGIDVNGVYAGRIVAGCAGLPNAGAKGEEKEFDGVDGNGPRSDASYVRLGLRDDLFNQLVLMVYGDWKDTMASTAAVPLVGVGVKDFFYKATQGYQDYSHGTDEGLFKCAGSMDCPLNQAVWTEILAPAHGL